MLGKFSTMLAEGLSMERESIIRDAVIHKLGEDYSLEDLKGRASMKTFKEDGREILFIDGEPIVEFYPPEFTSSAPEITENTVFNANMKYRKFYNASTKS